MTTSHLRRLTEKGVAEFESFIEDLRSGNTPRVPVGLLSDAEYSAPLGSEATIERRQFKTKLEMAEYVASVVDELSSDDRARFDPASSNGQGLWSWLGLWFFDALAPNKNGSRNVRAAAHYRYASDYAPFAAQRAYRHLVAMPYRVFKRHGAELSRGLLAGKPEEYHDHFEQIASRQDMWGDPGFLSLWHEIYFDPSLKKWDPRAGTARRTGPGSSRRLAMVFRQFTRTYDIRGMEADGVRRLLPAEFRFEKKYQS